MNTFTAFGHEFFDCRIRPRGLQKLDAAFADIQHRNPDALFIDLVVAGDLQPQRLFIDLYCLP